MYATLQAQNAYAAHVGTVRSPRANEYDTIARVTRRLKSAAETPGEMAALAAAVHDNRRLWTCLAADVSDPSNALPRDLRARIFYLAEFTRVHSGAVLRDGASVAPLIDVNSAVMRGLADQGGTK